MKLTLNGINRVRAQYTFIETSNGHKGTLELVRHRQYYAARTIITTTVEHSSVGVSIWRHFQILSLLLYHIHHIRV